MHEGCIAKIRLRVRPVQSLVERISGGATENATMENEALA